MAKVSSFIIQSSQSRQEATGDSVSDFSGHVDFFIYASSFCMSPTGKSVTKRGVAAQFLQPGGFSPEPYTHLCILLGWSRSCRKLRSSGVSRAWGASPRNTGEKEFAPWRGAANRGIARAVCPAPSGRNPIGSIPPGACAPGSRNAAASQLFQSALADKTPWKDVYKAQG